MVDCSVTIAWFFGDRATEATERWRVRRESAVAFVPALWRIEFANALLVAERRKKIDSLLRREILEESEALELAVDPLVPSSSRLCELASAHGLSGYDATYLELATRRRLPIATLDSALASAADAHGLLLDGMPGH